MPRLLVVCCAIVIGVMLMAARDGNARTSRGHLAARTLDTEILFSVEKGRPVVADLRGAEASRVIHNWATGTPEMALPEKVEVEGSEQTVTWEYKGASGEGPSVTFTYECGDPRLELISAWEGTSLPGPVEHKAILMNKGDRAIALCPTATIDVELAAQRGHGLEHWWVEKGGGRPSSHGTHTDPIALGYDKSLLSGPHSTNGENRDPIPWFSLQDSANKHGLYGGIEFTGWTRIRVSKTSGDGMHVSLGLDRRDGTTRCRVEPGETFEFPTCFIGVYSGEVDDGCNRLHRWVEKHIRPPVPGGVTPLLVNNSWGSGMAVDDALARRMIDDCADLGVELYHVDAGWFVDVGNWRSHPEKLPNGLEAIADYAHSKGLRFGLWVGWTQGGAHKNSGPDVLSVFSPQQKDWFRGDYPEDWHNFGFTGAPVCLACRDAREWCLRDLRRMIKDYKLDLLEHDQIMIIDRCTREGHGHIPNDPVDTSRVAALGYYEVYDQLREENPDLLFEDCVNGGCMVDFGVAKRCHYICATDTYDPLTLRQAFYDTSFPLPPSMSEAYIADHRGSTLANFKFMLRSGMMGWCTVMLDMSVWTPEQRDAGRREFELYKNELRPLIASGNLYHVLPRPDDVRWDGVQYFDPETGKGVLFVFRPNSDEDTHAIRLRGLDPTKRHAVHAEDGSVPDEVMSGAELMDSGLNVRLPEKHSSDLVFLTEQD